VSAGETGRSIAAMFEFHVDAAGKTRPQIYDTSAKAAHA